MICPMPNWAINSMIVYGTNKNEVEDFRQKLLNAKKRGDTLKTWHLYEIYAEFGYAKDFILNDDSNGYIRGSIIDIEDEISQDNECYWFEMQYESAWSSMNEGFDWLFKRHYTSLKQVTLCEEEGCEVFLNTDVEHKFFDEKYYLYVEDYDTHYIASDDELIKTINKYIENDKDKCHSVDDCFRYAENTEDYFMSLHQYYPD